eukprot:990823-Lingulodinium_polyedra.AAC.1
MARKSRTNVLRAQTSFCLRMERANARFANRGEGETSTQLHHCGPRVERASVLNAARMLSA